MRKSIRWVLPCVAAAILSTPALAGDAASLIDKAMTGKHRSDANKARDKYRHPKETLLFFGMEPHMTVVEISPSRGWYTEIIAPVVKEDGTFYAAVPPITDKSSDFAKKTEAAYRSLLGGAPDLYGNAKLSIMAAPDFPVAPAGSADLVVTFRNVHNWAKAGTAEAMFRGFYTALKPGGTLGVVEHRAKPGTDFQAQIKSGYMTEAYVIETAQKAGFKLDNKSEINANPRDTKDYPGGVWTLPPNLRDVPEADKARFRAIGESDRMTLKFAKP